MDVHIKIIDAFRNTHIPERFLTGSLQSTLLMFENQVCVCLRASPASGFFQTFEAEERIRNAFMDRLNTWIRDFPTIKPWSVVSHGTNTTSSGEYVCTLGFVFVDHADSDLFLKQFVVVEKLTG
jgi:hypothetical protein